MSDTITTSTPHLHWGGTQDRSTRKITRGSGPLPFFRPIFLTFASRGRTTPTWLEPLEVEKEYGSEVLNETGAYASQNTPFIKTAVANATKQWLIRLETEGSATATIGIDFEMVEYSVPEYKRNTEGHYEYDKNGALIPTGKSNPGYLGRWVFSPLAEGEELGSRVVKTGTLKGDDQKVSKIYPIADAKIADFGAEGNNYGLRLWAPTTRNRNNALDLELMEDIDAYPYLLSIVKRKDAMSTPTPIHTIYDNVSVPFSLKQNSIARNLGDMVLDMDEIIGNNWAEDNENYFTRSEVENFVVYHSHLETIHSLVHETESMFDTIDFSEESKYRTNILGATNPDGVPYYTLAISGPLNGDAALTESATHYFSGGNDGDMSHEAMDKAMRTFGETFRVNGIPLDRFAAYPFNGVWDTGFSIETKRAMGNLLSLPHTFVSFTTQDISRAPNTIEVDDSIGLSIFRDIQQYPDSQKFKTPPFRGNIISSVGEFVGSKRKMLVPSNLDRFEKWCLYGRLATGALDPNQAFDEDERKIITAVRKITNLDRDFPSKRRTWENGINYPEIWDDNRAFWSGYKSFYPDQTSVLCSEIIGLIIANIHRVCFEVWRSLTANAKLSPDQLVERSNRMIRQKTAMITDGRCTIVPKSRITDGDALRGYSWTCPIDLYAEGMPTVMDAFVVAYRAEDLNNGN